MTPSHLNVQSCYRPCQCKDGERLARHDLPLMLVAKLNLRTLGLVWRGDANEGELKMTMVKTTG